MIVQIQNIKIDLIYDLWYNLIQLGSKVKYKLCWSIQIAEIA